MLLANFDYRRQFDGWLAFYKEVFHMEIDLDLSGTSSHFEKYLNKENSFPYWLVVAPPYSALPLGAAMGMLMRHEGQKEIRLGNRLKGEGLEDHASLVEYVAEHAVSDGEEGSDQFGVFQVFPFPEASFEHGVKYPERADVLSLRSYLLLCLFAKWSGAVWSLDTESKTLCPLDWEKGRKRAQGESGLFSGGAFPLVSVGRDEDGFLVMDGAENLAAMQGKFRTICSKSFVSGEIIHCPVVK